MTSVKDAWRASALTTVLLPSGFRVRGVIPGPTEIIMKRIVPFQLRQAVAALAPKSPSTWTDAENTRVVEARRYQIVGFVRDMAPPGTTGDDGWERVELELGDLSSMPPMDVEALDDIIMGLRTPEMVTASSELRLGLRDKESAERIAQQEEAATVEGWTGFRRESGGAVAGEAGAALVDEAEQPAEPDQPAAGVRGRRRSAPAVADVGEHS